MPNLKSRKQPKKEAIPEAMNNNPAAELFDSPSSEGTDKKLKPMIGKYINLRKQRAKAEQELEKIKEQEAQLEDTLCTAMLSKGLKSIKQTSGVLVIANQKHEFFIKPESKEMFFKHLKKSGDGHLITTQVNYQTLQGHMNRLLEEMETKKSISKKVDGLKKYLDERTRNKLTVRGLKN